MCSEKSLRVIGYVGRDEMPERLACISDNVDVCVDEEGGTARIAIPTLLLDSKGEEWASDLVMNILGVGELPARQLAIQPDLDRREISVMLIDAHDQPSNVMGSEMVSIQEAVADFFRGDGL